MRNVSCWTLKAGLGAAAQSVVSATGGAVQDGIAGVQALTPARLTIFGGFLLAGLALLAVSFFVGLPVVVLFPSKARGGP